MPSPNPIYKRGRKVKPTKRVPIPGMEFPEPEAKPSLAKAIVKTAKNIIMKKSWKTTLGGLLMAGGPAIKGMLPDQWAWVGDAMLAIGGLIMGASARDNAVTSEEAKAK